MTVKKLRDFLNGLIAEGTADSRLTELRDVLGKEVARGYGNEKLDKITTFRMPVDCFDRIFYNNRVLRSVPKYPLKKDNVFKTA